MRKLLKKLLREQEEEQYYKMSPEEFLELMKLSGYHGNVTKLKKFGGKPIWITGPLDISNKPVDTLGNVEYIDGRLDISRTNISDISGIQVKGYVWDGGTPRERKRLAAELRQKKSEAEERRDAGEWDLETADDKGLKAHALFNWLVDNGDIEVMSDEERVEYNELKQKLEKLNEKYNSEELETDEVSSLHDEITEIESRLEELEEYTNDVYVIYPEKYKHYGLQQFEVIGIDGLKGREYTVGDHNEMEDAALDYAKGSVDELGIDGFNQSFVEDYIDKDYLESYVRDWYEDDVRNNPDVYFNDDDFELTSEQENRIEELENYIEELEDYIKTMEEEQSELENEIEDPDEYSQRYDEIQKMIDDAETKKEDAEEEKDSIEPDTEPTEEMIEKVTQDRIDEALYDPVRFIKNWDLELDNFIDKDELAQGLVDTDGWGIMNGYDGNYDSVSVNGDEYYIMRIN